MANDADTVTPLDGEDGHVTGIPEQFGHVQESDYETEGRTTVATAPGYRFASSHKGLPVITSRGVKMTKDEAEQVVDEAKGLGIGVHIVTNDENKEG